MRIEDVEVGKWYWFRNGPNAYCKLVVAKSETEVVTTYGGTDATVWLAGQCVGEATNKNKGKSWRSLWGLMQ